MGFLLQCWVTDLQIYCMSAQVHCTALCVKRVHCKISGASQCRHLAAECLQKIFRGCLSPSMYLSWASMIQAVMKPDFYNRHVAPKISFLTLNCAPRAGGWWKTMLPADQFSLGLKSWGERIPRGGENYAACRPFSVGRLHFQRDGCLRHPPQPACAVGACWQETEVQPNDDPGHKVVKWEKSPKLGTFNGSNSKF